MFNVTLFKASLDPNFHGLAGIHKENIYFYHDLTNLEAFSWWLLQISFFNARLNLPQSDCWWLLHISLSTPYLAQGYCLYTDSIMYSPFSFTSLVFQKMVPI